MILSILPPERQCTVTLRDGRGLGWYEWGPLDGQPVIFCPGAATSGSLGFGLEVLPRLGLRLMAIDRPGLGRSDHDPHKTLSTWAEDVRAWMGSCSVSGALAIGFSQGAPFALALAERGLVSAAAVVSGQDQLDHPAMLPLLHPDVRGMVESARRDPAAFEAHIAGTFGFEQMWGLVMGMSSEQDRAIYGRDDFRAAFRTALQQGFSQGSRGYARDLLIALTDWPFRAEDLRVPVDLWYGLRDTSLVHSPDYGQTLARRIPHSTLHTLPDQGSALLWTLSEEILAQLQSYR